MMGSEIKDGREVFDLLKSLRCMNGLSLGALKKLAHVGVIRKFKENQKIWEMGECGDYFCVLADGFVEIRRSSSLDQETCMGLFGPSDVIGLAAILKKLPYPANAEVICPATVIKIYGRSLLVDSHSDSSELDSWVREMILQHEAVLRDKIDVLNAGRIEDRVFECLFHLARRFGKYEGKSTCKIPVKLTKVQMGRMVNGRVETVIRLISRWRKEGYLDWTKNEIWIKDIDRLKKNLIESKYT